MPVLSSPAEWVRRLCTVPPSQHCAALKSQVMKSPLGVHVVASAKVGRSGGRI